MPAFAVQVSHSQFATTGPCCSEWHITAAGAGTGGGALQGADLLLNGNNKTLKGMLGRPQVAIQRHLCQCTAAQAAASSCSSRCSQGSTELVHRCTPSWPWQAEGQDSVAAPALRHPGLQGSAGAVAAAVAAAPVADAATAQVSLAAGPPPQPPQPPAGEPRSAARRLLPLSPKAQQPAKHPPSSAVCAALRLPAC